MFQILSRFNPLLAFALVLAGCASDSPSEAVVLGASDGSGDNVSPGAVWDHAPYGHFHRPKGGLLVAVKVAPDPDTIQDIEGLITYLDRETKARAKN